MFITAVTLGVPTAMAEEWWDVDISLEAKLPPGIIPKFDVRLLEPKCTTCEVSVDQDSYDGDLSLTIWSSGTSVTRPSSLTLEIRAQGFLPYVLKTGTLKYNERDSAWVDRIQFTPARNTDQIPSIVNLARIHHAPPGTETLEIGVANPTTATVEVRRIAGDASHPLIGKPSDCKDEFHSYRIELNVAGSAAVDESHVSAGRTLFSFPVQGNYRQGDCSTADSFDFDFPIPASVPAHQTTVFRFEIRFERILNLETYKPVHFDPHLFSGWDWTVRLALNNDTIITAELAEGVPH